MPNPSRPAHSSHRAKTSIKTKTTAKADAKAATTGGLFPYLIIMAGVAVGLFVAGQGSTYASRGAYISGGTLLLAALARLVLPQRRVGLLASRSKVIDVLAFSVLGGGVLALGLLLP